MVSKIGINDICGCGSGLKYKKCCGRIDKMLTEHGLLKVLHCLAIHADGLVVSCSELDKVPDTHCLGVVYDRDSDSFAIDSILKPEKPLIQISRSMPV